MTEDRPTPDEIKSATVLLHERISKIQGSLIELARTIPSLAKRIQEGERIDRHEFEDARALLTNSDTLFRSIQSDFNRFRPFFDPAVLSAVDEMMHDVGESVAQAERSLEHIFPPEHRLRLI
ncbi:MAG: hypothetical protein RI911_631 [Candidatus Parcubacteria bacterium]